MEDMERLLNESGYLENKLSKAYIYEVNLMGKGTQYIAIIFSLM